MIFGCMCIVACACACVCVKRMYLFALLWVAGESGIALKKGGISVCVCVVEVVVMVGKCACK